MAYFICQKCSLGNNNNNTKKKFKIIIFDVRFFHETTLQPKVAYCVCTSSSAISLNFAAIF